MMMGTILILANSSSGLYGFRNELILELVKQHSVHVSLPDDTNNRELLEEGCIIHHTDINRRGMNPIEDISLYKEYRRLIAKIRPDVILTYTIKPNVYGGYAAARSKVPYIANITGLGSALEGGGILQKVALMLYRVGLRRAQCVFWQNQSNFDFGKSHRMTKARCELLPGSGVNTGRFEVTKLPEDTMEFLFISRVMREKGIEEYLEMARDVKKVHPEAVFKILGQCEEDYTDILKSEEQAGTIEYVGRVLDVRPYLKDAQAVIHPSFYPEGMSNVCLEAAASGRSVITTDRPGCRETVVPGETGYLVPIKDAKSLTEAVLKYIELPYDERCQMGLNGRRYVEERFDRNIVVNKYVTEIQRSIRE